MADGMDGSRFRRKAMVALFAVWAAVVLVSFSLRHPVRAEGMQPAPAGILRIPSSLLFQYFAALGSNLLVLLGSAVLGRRLLAAMRALPSREEERLLLSTGLGLVVFTYATLGLGLAGALYRWVGWLLLVVPIAAAHRDTRGLVQDLRSAVLSLRRPTPLSVLLILVIAAVLAGTLPLSLSPPSAHDALVYHLNLPARYAVQHRVAPLPLNVYSSMPHNLEMVVTLCTLLGGEPAALLLHFFLRLLVVGCLFVLARRPLPTPGALLAVVLFLLNPITTTARTVGNIDLGMAFIFLLSILALLSAREIRSPRALWPVALMSGYLMGCKYTGLFFAVSVMLFVFLEPRRPRPREWVVLLFLFAAPVVPWLWKSLLSMGNPVYPLFPSVFESREWDEILGRQLIRWQRSMGMGREWIDYILLPWNLTVEGQIGRNYRYFDGVISPLPLAFVPLLALIRDWRRWVWWLGLGLIPFVGWAATSQQIRFLTPLLPLTALATAGILWTVDRDGVGSKRVYFRIIGTGSALLCLFLLQVPPMSRNIARTLPVVTGRVSRDAYLTETVQPHAVVLKANEILPPSAGVLMIWENRAYHLERPYLADSFFEASQIARRAARAGNPAAFAENLGQAGITHVIYNHGLGAFFSQMYGPEYVSFLERFVNEELEALYSAREVTLYRLRE